MIQNIWQDMMEPIGYLPIGIIAGAIYLLVHHCFERVFLKPHQYQTVTTKWIRFLGVIYVAVLLKLAFFSREPGSRKGIDLQLFSTWNESFRGRAFFIENIIMFLPFGVLVPMLFPKVDKGWKCILLGFWCSVALEGAQLLTQRGYCQLDDVLTNTIGTAVGWLVYWICKRCFSG